SGDVGRIAGHIGARADDVVELAGRWALHPRVESALDRVLERLSGDWLVRGWREPEAAADRELVRLSIGRARWKRLRDLGHELERRRTCLVGVVEELCAGRVQELRRRRDVRQSRI